MNANPLKNYRILIADPDVELGHVLRSMMVEMGFSQCEHITNGLDAYRKLKNAPYDFLITEWGLSQMDGVQLLRKIRRAPDSPLPTLPVIMLTGRAEQDDVCAARDAGINEFVVKPFSAKSIYQRIERIIEHPRQFVISPSFVGPNRRIHGTPPPDISDRRVHKVKPQLQPVDVHGAMQAGSVPRLWLPDFSLKYKLGTNLRLESLITAAVLEQAQAAVDVISDASLGWIKTNLQEMRLLLNLMVNKLYPPNVVEEMNQLAMSVNAHAGTFGYSRASEIAYLLYRFCRHHLNPDKTEHHTILQKHIDVLQVILGNQMRGSAGEIGSQLAAELKKLAEKFSFV